MLKKKESVIIKFDFSAEQTVGDITKIVGLTMAKYLVPIENVNSKCEKNIKKYNQASRANSSRHSANTISAVFQPNISRG